VRKVRGGRGGTSGRPPRRGSKLNNDCCAECIVAFFVWQLQDFRLRQSYDVTSRRGQERRMMLIGPSRCSGGTSGRVLEIMGHNYGRDNVKKRAVRRKKTARLAVARKQPSRETTARQEKKTAK
jgi:hypothetical protein